MTQNDITILKYAVMEGVVNALAAIDSADVANGTAKPAKQNTQKVSAKALHTDTPTKKKHNSYRVDNLAALYKLADAELLDKINGAIESRKYPGTRMYFVDRCPETKAVLAEYLSERELAEDA